MFTSFTRMRVDVVFNLKKLFLLSVLKPRVNSFEKEPSRIEFQMKVNLDVSLDNGYVFHCTYLTKSSILIEVDDFFKMAK